MIDNKHPHLAREIDVSDATMLVMGGMVGADIFMNPSVVARGIHSPILGLMAWGAAGGKGGKKRTATLTVEERRELAGKAARARWGKATKKNKKP